MNKELYSILFSNLKEILDAFERNKDSVMSNLELKLAYNMLLKLFENGKR